MAQDNTSKDGPLAGYYEKEEAALALRVTVRTLDRWHLLRDGPRRTMVGGRVLYRRAAIEDWLRSREDGPAQRGRR